MSSPNKKNDDPKNIFRKISSLITETADGIETQTTPIPSVYSSEDETWYEEESLRWKADEEEEEFLSHSMKNIFQRRGSEEELSFQRLPDGTLLSARDILSGVRLELDEESNHYYSAHDEEVAEKPPPSLCMESRYGVKKSGKEIASLMGPPSRNKSWNPGLIYHAHLLPDGTIHTSPELLKPRRPTLSVRHSDFMSSLVELPDKRWVFSGVLNGWPGLGYDCPLQVLSITYRPKSTTARIKKSIARWWNHDRKNGGAPSIPPLNRLQNPKSVRVTLRTPPWAARGWTKPSPGFTFYYDGQSTCRHGTDMLSLPNLDMKAATAHHFQHRYALPKGKRESAKDLLTYHAAVLIEWEPSDKPKHTTLIELALLGGIGGYCGRCNWYHDKDGPNGSMLYRSLPPSMILPWRTDACEIRIYDLPHCPTMQSLLAYMEHYTGPGQRFLDPHVASSYPVRLSYRTKRDIMKYCLNNVARDPRYNEVAQVERNCQTFAADFFGFLVGKKGIEPISKTNKFGGVLYKPRHYLFLYDAEMYYREEEEESEDASLHIM